ncbi:MAG: hypothetical protein QF632_00735 [Candidatus Woesearchaeota archaeon]|jgi:hypothetical protein|nr:hypothetical protein [Candidatus Woesearchaeota archaeon]MDP7323266.1 hypothetical protein [Candidatus Woesearchaeota archaeon]MDP7457771.1 hypothetical protein [Candidatus Woesearchaeota archaeon]
MSVDERGLVPYALLKPSEESKDFTEKPGYQRRVVFRPEDPVELNAVRCINIPAGDGYVLPAMYPPSMVCLVSGNVSVTSYQHGTVGEPHQMQWADVVKAKSTEQLYEASEDSVLLYCGSEFELPLGGASYWNNMIMPLGLSSILQITVTKTLKDIKVPFIPIGGDGKIYWIAGSGHLRDVIPGDDDTDDSTSAYRFQPHNAIDILDGQRYELSVGAASVFVGFRLSPDISNFVEADDVMGTSGGHEVLPFGFDKK